MNIQDLLGSQSNSPWEKYVPIIAEKNNTEVYITDEIAEPSAYNELCHALLTASRAENFTIYLNTPGGIIDSAVMIVDAITSSKAKVTAKLSGTVASAGTIIALACSKVEVADHTSFMVHNYSSGMIGKGGELKARQKHVEESLEDVFKTLYAGFLTEEEIADVVEDKDMWMGKTEILERWKTKIEYNKAPK